MPASYGSVRSRDFLGLQTNLASGDRKAGASAKQVNVTHVKRGQITVRAGTRPVRWEV